MTGTESRPCRLSRYQPAGTESSEARAKCPHAPLRRARLHPSGDSIHRRPRAEASTPPRPTNFSRLLMSSFLLPVLKFDSWGALKIGTADPPSHARVATATQCVSAILGVYLNGTLNQVAVRVGRAQVPVKAADIAWFLCTSSHPAGGVSSDHRP